MTQTIKMTASLLTMLVVSSLTTQANADVYRHIDQLALKIQRSSKRLINETRHYRHTPQYGHLVADTNAIYRLAKHIHDVTHFEGNLNHLQRDLDELDRQFHHLERVFDQVEHDAAFGIGHVHGNTAHVKRLLNTIEDAIHHISIDVREIRQSCIGARHDPVHTKPAVYSRPVYRVNYGSGYYGRGGSHIYSAKSGHGYGGFGISFGGGSSRIHIRF